MHRDTRRSSRGNNLDTFDVLQVLGILGIRVHVRYATDNQNSRAHYFEANGTKVARSECCWLAHFPSVVHGPIWFDNSLFSLYIPRQICPTKVRILPDYCNQKNLHYIQVNKLCKSNRFCEFLFVADGLDIYI